MRWRTSAAVRKERDANIPREVSVNATAGSMEEEGTWWWVPLEREVEADTL